LKNYLTSITFLFFILSVSSVIYAQQIQINIGLVHSELSLSSDKSGNQPPSTAWEYFLLNNKIRYDVLRDEDLSSDDLSDYNLIILPETKSLNDEAFENLTEYLNDGGNLWMLGNIGERNQNDKQREKSFSEFILGSSFSIMPSKNKFTANLNFVVDELITPKELSHSKLLLSFQRNIYETTANRKSFLLGYYESLDNSKHKNATIGILASTFGRGRVLWFGFQIDQLIGKEDQKNFNLFFYSAINWLSNTPNVQLNYLPGNLSSYKIFSAIINDIESLNKISDEIKNSNSQINLFFRPENFENLIRLIGFESHNYTFNLAISIDEINSDKFNHQLQELSMNFKKLFSDNKQQNIGLFVRGDIYDLTSLKQISESGVTFIFDNKNFYIFDSNNNLRIFPSYSLISNAVSTFQSKMPLELNSERIYNYLLIDDQQTNMNRSSRQTISAEIENQHSQIDGISIDNVIEYFFAIENINVEITLTDDSSFDITISNNNRFEMNDLSFKLLLPEGTAELNYEMLDDNISFSKLKYENQFFLIINSIAARQKINLTFSYETSFD
jgi:hypothetical protein